MTHGLQIVGRISSFATGVNVYFAQFRWYWTGRAWIRKTSFALLRRAFAIRYSLREEKLSVGSLFDFFRFTVPQLLWAGVVAFALLLSELYLPEWPKFGLWRIAEGDSYATFLASIAGIGGVFIGLYYAALTAVGSAIYSKVPTVIRTLLIRERLGTVYMRFMAFLTFLPLCLVALYELGFSPIRLAVPFMLVLSGVGIISFVQLGQRAFYFFDPTRLAYPVFDDLRTWVQRASVGGYRWDDKAFQYHAQRQARAAIAALNMLFDISAKEKHLKSGPMVEIAAMLINFLAYYEQQRAKIPSSSLWYGRAYKHQEWFYTSDLETQLASQTASALRPEEVADSEWVEELCIPMLIRTLRANLGVSNAEQMPHLFQVLELFLQTLGRTAEVKKAFGIIEQLAECILSQITVSPGHLEQYEVIDRLASWPSWVLLSWATSDVVMRYDRTKDLQRVDWLRPATLYTSGFPEYLLPRMEWMQPRFKFELSIEGRIVSPKWYQLELTSQIDAEKLAENLTTVLEASERFYAKWVSRSELKTKSVLAAFVTSRHNEYLTKLEINIDKFISLAETIDQAKVLKDLPWPTWAAEEWTEKLTSLRKANILEQAKQAAKLVGATRPSSLPDHAGEFLHCTGDAILQGIITGDSSPSEVLPYYFFASIKKVGALIGKSTAAAELLAMPQTKWAVGPLSDLAELTGYAILFSEFYGDPKLWSTLHVLWDKYLGKDPSPLAVVIVLLASNQTPGMIAPRALVHTNWSTRVQQKLGELPKRELWSGSGFTGFHSEAVPEHPSPLVRVMAEGPFLSFYTGTDIFVSEYLSKQPGAGPFLKVIHTRDLESAIRHQKDLYTRFQQQSEEANEEI